MDNALIDDRRIHVDFSQSVSKLWSQHWRRNHQMGKGMVFSAVSLSFPCVAYAVASLSAFVIFSFELCNLR